MSHDVLLNFVIGHEMFQHWIHITSLWKRFQGGDIGVVDEESFGIVYMEMIGGCFV